MSLEITPYISTKASTRAGTPADAVLGVVPGLVIEPHDPQEVSEVLGWAAGEGLKVVPCGARTKLDRGAAPHGCDILLDMSRLAQVVEHAAGDLTVTVQAGVRLPDLQRQLAGAGQFLAVDPPVPGTIGGLIAAADTGPRRLRYGGVRDLILGVTFVRADGVVAKAGGKVVKNVAGYDLPKLLTGSLGTLAVVIEATFRLYPLPAASATVVADIAPNELRRQVGAILQSTLVPISIDYFTQPPGESVLAVRFEGTHASVQAQAQCAVRMLGASSRIVTGGQEQELWQRFDRVVQPAESDVLCRLVSTVSDLPGLLEGAYKAAEEAGTELTVRAHAGHGHALLRWRGGTAGTAIALVQGLRAEAEALGHNLVVWRAPGEVRSRVEIWGEVGEGLPLMRKVKQQFDPNGTLNPGRFVGGI
ncbi:MAG: FAD-binding oxidoreductase [Chloroflexota bacterium]|nr:FAD-binding oxidoreductase [Chloroflexota bacterium]MDQ5866906.1 FAD-binding oxidoreductase [Chloroflexota bacterium]